MKNQSTRRDVLAGLAAAPVAGLPAPAARGALAALIAAYWEAQAALLAACEAFDELEAAYRRAGVRLRHAPNFLSGAIYEVGGIDGMLSREDARQSAHEDFGVMRAGLRELSKIAPEIAAQAVAAIDAVEAENVALINRLFDEEDARQEAFGLGALGRRRDALIDAYNAAADALCAYRCKTLDEARVKVAAILASDLQDDIDDRGLFILRSFVDG